MAPNIFHSKNFCILFSAFFYLFKKIIFIVIIFSSFGNFPSLIFVFFLDFIFKSNFYGCHLFHLDFFLFIIFPPFFFLAFFSNLILLSSFHLFNFQFIVFLSKKNLNTFIILLVFKFWIRFPVFLIFIFSQLAERLSWSEMKSIPKFRFLIRQFAFHFAIMLLEKARIHRFSPVLEKNKNTWADWSV